MVVYIWMIGLFFLIILCPAGIGIVSAPVSLVGSIPIGLAGTILGIPLGWLWYRWRGDII